MSGPAAAAVVAATDGASIWQIGVVLGCLALSALLWILFHESAVGKCLLSFASFLAIGAFGAPFFRGAVRETLGAADRR